MPEILSSHSDLIDQNSWHGDSTAWQELGNVPSESTIDPRWDENHQYSGLTYEEWKAGKEFPTEPIASGVDELGEVAPIVTPELSTLPENFREIEEIEEIGEVALDTTVDFPDKDDDSSDGLPVVEAVHSLEKLSEKPIFSVTIDGKRTNFTELFHYNPKVESTTEVYPVPAHLSAIAKDDLVTQTYEKTTQESRWQEKLFDFTQDFLTNDPRGKVLVEGLEIQSLAQLTPEQATKLSLGMVELLSQYSKDTVAGGDAADEKTTLQILYEGKMKKNQPGWGGNGICRNIASNVKAVFEALKDNQDEQNMLKNTYVVLDVAMSGKTYGVRERHNPNGVEKDERLVDFGHAWNTFITIGKGGESAITTVDGTLALDDAQPDYTIERTYENAQKLYEQADDKLDASVQMVHYLDKFVHRARAEKVGNLDQRIDFAFTEYVKYAEVMLKTNNEMVMTPAFDIYGRAYKLREDLSKKEVETVFGVAKATERLEGHETAINGVIDALINNSSDDTDKLIVSDNDLQRLIFERMGDKLAASLAKDKINILKTGGFFSRRFNQVMS